MPGLGDHSIVLSHFSGRQGLPAEAMHAVQASWQASKRHFVDLQAGHQSHPAVDIIGYLMYRTF
jgi:hypothetical protein